VTTRAHTVRSEPSASRSSEQRVDLVECAQHRALEVFLGLAAHEHAAQPALGRPRDSATGVVDHDRGRWIGRGVGEDRAVVRRARLPNIEKIAAVHATEELERAHRLEISDQVRVLVTRRDVQLQTQLVEIAKSLDDARHADVDAPANVFLRRVGDAIRLSRRRPRTTDFIAHLVKPPTDVLGVPLANARGWGGYVSPLVARKGASGRTRIRVRPRVRVASELGGQKLAEQPTVLRTEHRVVDEHATFVDEQCRDLRHVRTAIIHDVKTRLLAADSPGAVEEAAAALARGELVAFPTDTVYGLSAGHEHVRKLYGAKDRPKEKRIPVLLSDIGNLEASAIVTPIARALAHRFWPGPLTIVLVAPRRGTMAFRVPDHPLARRLIAASGGGLPVTSANRSGEPDARTAQEVIGQLDGRIALVLDGGTTPGGMSSTVVDCTTDQVKILRPGAISEAEIDQVLATVV